MNRQVAKHRQPLYRRQRLFADQVSRRAILASARPPSTLRGRLPGAIEHLGQPVLYPVVCGHDCSPRGDFEEPGQFLEEAAGQSCTRLRLAPGCEPAPCVPQPGAGRTRRQPARLSRAVSRGRAPLRWLAQDDHDCPATALRFCVALTSGWSAAQPGRHRRGRWRAAQPRAAGPVLSLLRPHGCRDPAGARRASVPDGCPGGRGARAPPGVSIS